MISLDDKKILIISICVSAIALIFGAFHLLGQWEFYEPGQGILLGIYAAACFVLFFAIRFTKPSQIVAAVILLGMVIFYANLKFEWRKNYVQGEPFLLESYIDAYPTMEENTFGGLMGYERWVQFSNECVEPSLNGESVPRTCRSSASIRDEYNIDPVALVNNRFKVMKRTAQRIQDETLTTKRAYQQCLANKTCAIIPLLPANVNPDEIERQSSDYLQTRRMFWSLVNDTEISPEICEYMDLCRAMRMSGVMAIEEPDTSPQR